MQRLRVRFTVRRLMLAVVTCGVSIVLIPALLGLTEIQAALIGSGLCLGVLFESGGGQSLFLLGAISGMIALGVGAWLALPPRPIGASGFFTVLGEAIFGAMIGVFLGGQLERFYPGGQVNDRDK